MSYSELLQPCALFETREAAEEAVALLAESKIDAQIGPPDSRTHGLSAQTCQVSVAGSQLSRARALLNAR